MAITGHGVSFRCVACELSIDYLVEMFCGLNSRERTRLRMSFLICVNIRLWVVVEARGWMRLPMENLWVRDAWMDGR